jgi:hypothetical protein
VLVAVADRGDRETAIEARVELDQLDPDVDSVQGKGAMIRSALACLDGNRWLAAQIFDLASHARGDLVQVASYLVQGELRSAIQARVRAAIGDETEIIIAHSLGSVVGWETCSVRDHALPLLLTIGSPLGLDGLILPKLRPAPPAFPPRARRWVNVAHPEDFIAVEQHLARLFPSGDERQVEDHNPEGRSPHHSARGYLEQPCVGLAIAETLSGPS